MEYASKATANTGLGFGIAGTALSLLNGGANLLGGMTAAPASPEDRPVSRYEIGMLKELIDEKQKNAILSSEQITETKIADVYERIMTRVNSDRQAQQEVNAAQAVYNATNGATVATINSQVAQLMSLTALHIPADKVCPTPMPQFNSWTAPT